MRFESYVIQNIPASAATGPSSPLPSRNHRDKYIQITGIAGGGVAKVEGTIDGSNWVVTTGTGSNMAADGVFTIPETFNLIRVNRTTAGTGTWVATFAGWNVRVDG